MSKKQIRISQNDIRRMVSEAIRSYSLNEEGFNGKSDDKYDINGNERRPEGEVFSTDSEEGEALKTQAEKYGLPRKSEDSTVIWDPMKKELKDAEDNVTGAKWSNTVDSSWDSDKKRDMIARDEFGDEEKEGQLYDKPFGDMDDIENQWADEPGYEDEDDDDNIAGLNEGTVTLNEGGLRKFISYSVAKLLKEGNLGTTVHFGKKESEAAAESYPNPYKDMTWDEYCETKRKEHEKDKGEEDERGEHMFDDQHWVDKMKLSKDDLQEMVRKTLEEVITNGQQNIFIAKINDAMKAIRAEMADIEERYEEAEEDPTQSDYYIGLQDAYAALEGLIAY